MVKISVNIENSAAFADRKIVDNLLPEVLTAVYYSVMARYFVQYRRTSLRKL